MDKGLIMAMGTGKSSKALHNFAMPFELRWGNRKQMGCVKVNSDGDTASPGRFVAVDWHPFDQCRREDSVQHRRGSDVERGRDSGSPSEFPRGSHKSSRAPPLASGGGRRSSDDGIAAVREKLILDLHNAAERMKNAVFEAGKASPSPPAAPPPPLPPGTATSMVAETHRPWNLRTRRAACKTTSVPSLNGGGAAGEKTEYPTGARDLVAAPNLSLGSSEMKVSESPGTADRFLRSTIGEKRDRRRFSVALSKAEIEEDLYGMVGHRPARRPKKRARIVQRQLDTLFPGLWLKEVTPDMYKVYEAAP